jgi:hypothetical protein
MTSTIETWLLDAQGRCVEQVEGEFYVGCQPAADQSPISIWVQFAGATRVRLFGKPDGWGMGLDETPATGSDMGSAGRTVIKDMAKMKPFLKCMESALQGAALFTSAGSREPVGVRLSFESGGVILILNWGDELVVDSRPPKDAAPGDLVVCPVEKAE